MRRCVTGLTALAHLADHRVDDLRAGALLRAVGGRERRADLVEELDPRGRLLVDELEVRQLPEREQRRARDGAAVRVPSSSRRRYASPGADSSRLSPSRSAIVRSHGRGGAGGDGDAGRREHEQECGEESPPAPGKSSAHPPDTRHARRAVRRLPVRQAVSASRPVTISNASSTAVSWNTRCTAAEPRTSTSRRPAFMARRRAATSRASPHESRKVSSRRSRQMQRRLERLDALELLVERVRVLEVQLAPERDLHGVVLQLARW